VVDVVGGTVGGVVGGTVDGGVVGVVGVVEFGGAPAPVVRPLGGDPPATEVEGERVDDEAPGNPARVRLADFV